MLFEYYIFNLSQRESIRDTPALNVAETALMQNREVLAPQPRCRAPQHRECHAYHRALLSAWLSNPVCRRGNSPERRLMGLLDWFLAAAAETGG